jgi:hypothetical protein
MVKNRPVCENQKHKPWDACRNCGATIGTDEGEWENDEVWFSSRYGNGTMSDNEPCVFCGAECAARWFCDEVSDGEELKERFIC